MPTYTSHSRFRRDVAKLTLQQRQQLKAALTFFIADLRAMESDDDQWFRHGLVSKLHGTPSLYELKWAQDGRATFSFGDQRQAGRHHIEWHRCGTHDILP